MRDREPSGALRLGRAHKPYLGAELTFLPWVEAGTGREHRSRGSPARLGAPWVPRRQCAAVPGWQGGHGAVPQVPRALRHLWPGQGARQRAGSLARWLPGSSLRGTEVAPACPWTRPHFEVTFFGARTAEGSAREEAENPTWLGVGVGFRHPWRGL